MTDHSGINLQLRDTTVRPQDDFYAYSNGKWLAEHEIPADRARDGAFMMLTDRAEAEVHTIVERAAAGDELDDETRKIGDFYASFMDVATIDAAGVTPIAAELVAVSAVADHAGLAELLARLQRTGVGGPMAVQISTDAKNSQRYLLHLDQSGLGLPDESYYREDKYADIRAAYAAHVEGMFALVAAEYAAADVIAVETTLAAAHWDVVKRRDSDLVYNLMTVEALIAHAPGFAWETWMRELTSTVPTAEITGATELVVGQPSFVEGLGRAWVDVPLPAWQAWAAWRIICARAPYLASAVVEENFGFYGKTLSGTPEIRDRWKRGVAFTNEMLGHAVGRLYVERNFPPEAKTRMLELVANLQKAYRRSITDLDWMGPATRDAALAKLATFTSKIGYPDVWRDYSPIVADRGDLVGNHRRGCTAEFNRQLAKLGKQVDRTEWFMTPQTVNAYYNARMNEIVFPAAILQSPFFDPTADEAANYGGIGAVIGHEIGHGFDDQGSKYDGNGNMLSWWTDDDRAQFGVRVDALIAQFNELAPRNLPDHRVNGALTIGENIGDVGGLAIALEAYKMSLNGQPAPMIDGMTGAQRVFAGWAQIWQSKSREAEAVRLLAIDPHSPPDLRCNGVVRNIDAFYDAYDVQPGDGMYLDPAERVKIW